MEIRCGKLVEGKVCHGTLVETGLPEEKNETISVGELVFDKQEVEKALATLKPIFSCGLSGSTKEIWKTKKYKCEKK